MANTRVDLYAPIEPVFRPRYVHQLPGSRTCGQVAVAALTGIPLERILYDLPLYHGTRTRDLVTLLRSYGYTVADRLKRSPSPPRYAIAKVVSKHRRRGNWHWVAHADGLIYDGNEFGEPLRYVEFLFEAALRDALITSWLEVTA